LWISPKEIAANQVRGHLIQGTAMAAEVHSMAMVQQIVARSALLALLHQPLDQVLL
jgi:hypothetical protein